MSRLSTKFIKDGAVTDAKVSTGIDAAKLADGSVSNAELQYISGVTSDVQTQLGDKIASSEKGANSGVATLDGGGKIPTSQLPNSVMEYQGNWVASTNSPSLSNGVGNAGDVYKATDAGAVDFGAGNIVFAAGDFAVYSGTIWEKSINSNEVASVNSQTGVVVLDADDISDAATTNKFATAAELSAIATNSAKVSADGLVTTHSDVTSAGSGIIISGAERTKLNGIEALATADQTGAEIKVAYEAEADTNAFDDAAVSKLSGIEASAKDDQSAAEVVYSNGTSSLTATDVQAAIDEVEGRVDSLEGASAPLSASEVLTLIAGDITAEAVSLSNSPRGASVVVSVDGIVQTPGVDYSVSGSSLRFGNVGDAGLTSSDLDPTTGAAALVIGDVIVVKYEY